MTQQAQTQPVQPVPAKTPIAPASQSAPLPLDPNLLRHVGGGASAAGPNGGW
jgi:hypothetical protein